MNPRNNARLYAMAFASVYPLYIEKAEKKGRSRGEVDEVIRWLTGYSQEGLEQAIAEGTSFADFFARAPAMNPARTLITGVVCGVRVEEIEEQPMRGREDRSDLAVGTSGGDAVASDVCRVGLPCGSCRHSSPSQELYRSVFY